MKRNIYADRRDDFGFQRGRIISIVVVMIVFIIIVWQGEHRATAPESRTLVLYCFTGMQEVMENGVIPIFKEYWQDEYGEHVEVISTFAGSGTIVDKIISRFPAEVAILSSPVDAVRLSERLLISSNWWKTLPNAGVFNRSAMIMIVRDGNPLDIQDFSDLSRPGIEFLHPNLITSGAGQWAILAIYGSALRVGSDSVGAIQRVAEAWQNVIEQPASARDAVQLFIEGTGDVLIMYEANLRENIARDQIPGQLVYPSSTIVTEHIVLPINRNIRSGQEELVNSFIQFLWSAEVQHLLAAYGYHGLNDSLDNIKDTFTLESLGVPRRIKSQLIDTLIAALTSTVSY
ncbi:MAG: substrate-binding domain-containing protein [Fidelibacterota bacterium]|nr:MAG: substrate-binding domain-containing protein [Candidatus Neomarinimicrobiota bacterium]